jgi:uncharacterized protein YggE
MKTIAVAILSTLLLGGPAMAADTDRTAALAPSITVVGSDKVAAKPDMAEIQVGVTTQAPTAAKALKDNNQAMAALVKVLSARGIADKDQQTSSFNISPQYRQGTPGVLGPEIVGYQVSNQLHIKVRQLASLGELLDEVVSAGSNQVHGISFSVADPTPLLDEARRKAMADARRKAELYAKAAGVGLGQVLLIEEQTAHLPRPQMMGAAMGRGAAAVPVAAGEQEFAASVTVTYRIK